jgi:hypothetical protein
MPSSESKEALSREARPVFNDSLRVAFGKDEFHESPV